MKLMKLIGRFGKSRNESPPTPERDHLPADHPLLAPTLPPEEPQAPRS